MPHSKTIEIHKINVLGTHHPQKTNFIRKKNTLKVNFQHFSLPLPSQSLNRYTMSNTLLIGRLKEQDILNNAYKSNKSEFIAIYGRRRVGKTFLVKETFQSKFTFFHTGIAHTNTRGQLQNFQRSLRRQGFPNALLPANWLDAFDALIELLENKGPGKKIVFIDELPWLDAPRSSFLAAFEHFWNGWASLRNDILLIVCGSATSWIIKNIVRSHGGLHNRLTNQIALEPFTLKECELYAQSLKLPFNRRHILEAYMILGGIPFYWSLLNKQKSLVQNIDDLIFNRHGELHHEFDELYASLFEHPERHIDIITALGRRKSGMSREELIENTKIPYSQKFTRILDELENCGFIRSYRPIGKKNRGTIFQLIDNFTLFYFKFLDGHKNRDDKFWSIHSNSPAHHNWSGLAFERICLLHSKQIKYALGIAGISTEEYAWRCPASNTASGAEIDLLIDRSDQVINVCEIKFHDGPFTINKQYDASLQNKLNLFREATRTKKALLLTFITSYGLKDNTYAMNVHNQITADDLFAI